jgi:predicted enzyme related to lactoylglutathione lyase
MEESVKINYIEMPSRDLPATKRFFNRAFGWSFVDYGEDYASFLNAGIDGGFYTSEKNASTENGSVLVVLYSSDLENTLEKVISAGGEIIKEIYSFPGGRRFHFSDPSGNEYAVWSEEKTLPDRES